MGYDELIEAVKEYGVLASVSELLGWDQEVMMPKDALPVRKQQRGVVAGLVHDLRTRDVIGEQLDTVGVVTGEQEAQVREIRRDYERATAVSKELVREMEETSTDALEAWRTARENDDFGAFAPILKKQIRLQKRYARAIDADRHPYQVLLEEYEDGIPLADIKTFFAEIKEAILPLIQESTWDETVLDADVSKEVQRELVRDVAAAIGYDFDKGRLDESTHPFTSAYGRITTRYENWLEAITATMHEAGHGMYEHGLPVEHFGTPLGEYCSMSIHESQSRLWENHVGRSQEFWQHWYDDVQEQYGLDASLDEVMAVVQRVAPGLIRVQADEVTYSMHIILRFEVELALFEDRLDVEDLPRVWTQKMEEYLGVTPPNDSKGVLQDIHWAMGNFGYFPTYSLGSMIAAQLFAAAAEDIDDLMEKIASGDYDTLHDWLERNIWQYGRRFSTKEMVRRATGEELSSAPYVAHLRRRYV